MPVRKPIWPCRVPGFAGEDMTQRGLIAVPLGAFHKPSAPTVPIRVVDLFAGAGGFSLGFAQAGAEIAAAVEIDPWAADTFKTNHPKTTLLVGDIAEISDDTLREACGCVDVLIGGPPCQGFSISNPKGHDPKDTRNSLFREFVRAAKVLNPSVVLMENVPGLLAHRTAEGEKVIDVICGELRRIGYRTQIKVLQAAEYGVPQMRRRLFILGTKDEWDRPFPEPTHYVPSEGSAEPPGLLPAVTVWDAIGDLPELEAGGVREHMMCSGLPRTPYQALMNEGQARIFNHVARRHSFRVVERFAALECGESGGRDAPPELRARRKGGDGEASNRPYQQNNYRVPPGLPCRTIPAAFNSSFVHPFQDRSFTPREGARIQSFPDWFAFCGKPATMSRALTTRNGQADEWGLSQYVQIGNAVPPLLAYHLARHVVARLTGGQIVDGEAFLYSGRDNLPGMRIHCEGLKRGEEPAPSGRPKMKAPAFTFSDLFAGIGGFRLALESLGGQCLFSSEIDRACRDTYAKNFGDYPSWDIRKIDPASIPDHDFLCAGFPCQSFSRIAQGRLASLGKEGGLKDKKQGTLFFTLAEVISAKRPKMFLLENVANLAHHDRGRTLRTILSTLYESGYVVHYKIMEATPWVPQTRPRLFIVGFDSRYFDMGGGRDFVFPEPPEGPQLLIGHILEDTPDVKTRLTDQQWEKVIRRGREKSDSGKILHFRPRLMSPGDVSKTLLTQRGGNSALLIEDVPGKNPRCPTVLECAKLMGFPSSFVIPDTEGTARKMFGNSVVPGLVAHLAKAMLNAAAVFEVNTPVARPEKPPRSTILKDLRHVVSPPVITTRRRRNQ